MWGVGTQTGLSAREAQNAAGFTLIELLIAILILIIATVLVVSQHSSAGQGDRFIQQAASRLRERRSAAIKLNPLPAATSLESYTQPPLVIDFQNPATTAALALEGTTVTQFNQATGAWVYSYQGQPLSAPPGWRLATTTSQLFPVPPLSANRGF
ncbi:MAG: prepilin-type N-terminal cleavage/methylation domain-containing protein, partial [Blastocatellia bacterium]